LDETAYKELEGILIPAIHNEQRRTLLLKRIKAAMGQDLRLNGATADQVLCGDVNLFPSCLTREKITEYADALAAFLGTLGCDNGAIARGLSRRMSISSRQMSPDDPLQMAFAKHVAARPEKDCPGWAALTVVEKDFFRKLAAEKTSAP
jgi:hypothetical protein